MSLQSNLSPIFERKICSRLVMVGTCAIFLVACSSGSDKEETAASDGTIVNDSPFFDDFSVDTTALDLEYRLSEDASSTLVSDGGVATLTVNSNSTDSERVRFRYNGTTDTWGAVLALEPGTEATGEARAYGRITARLFNDTSADSCVGDIDVNISSRLDSGDRYGFTFGAWRISTEDCNSGEDYALFDGQDFLRLPDIAPVPGTSNQLLITLDRENSQVILNVDDQSFTYPINTSIFPPTQNYFVAESRVSEGPGTAIVRFEEFTVDTGDLFIPEENMLGRYSLFSNGQPVSVENGELRLESNSTEGRVDNRFRINISEQRYIKADMRLSSESVLGTNGSAQARVGGSLYYAASEPPNDNATGQVFAVSELVANEDGTMDARYCAYQALNADFTESISLTNPDSESGCNSFSVSAEFDQTYTMGVRLDEQNSQIVFSLNEEVISLPVEGEMSMDENLFEMRLQSRAIGQGTKSVVYADNLKMDPSVD